MIFLKKRSSPAKSSAAYATQQDTQRKNAPALVGILRKSRDDSNDVVEDEKKEDSQHSADDTLPVERVAAPPTAAAAAAASPAFSITQAVAASGIVASGREGNTSSGPSRAANAGPVDLDDTIISEDSFLGGGEGGDLAVETMKESIQDLLGLGGGGGNQIFASGNSSRNNDDDDDEDQGCLLFEDDDDDQSPLGLPAAELPTQLRPATLFAPPQVDTACISIHTDHSQADEPDYESVQRTRSGAKPPTEINIDLDAVPPSPMRDPSDAFAQTGGTLPMMLHHPNSTGSPPAEVEIDFGAELGLRTKLCDAERLVRIILGKTSQNHPLSSSQKNRYAALERGSVLQAIRSFAMMKQELIDLRQQQENNDGDPPAILTNLASPATTNNTSSISTPAHSISPKTLEQPSSSLSPDTETGGSIDETLWQRHQQNLKTTRNALVMAARKCQSLEQQLKQANQTIDRLQLEHNPRQSAIIHSLEERLEALEAENRILRKNNARDAASKSAPKTPGELEDILAKLHNVPASSVSHDERQKIRKYVLDMIDSTKDQNQKVALERSQQRELDARRSLQLSKDRIRSLQAQLDRFTGKANGDGEILDPIKEAHRRLEQKNERIAQLEESQVRLQSIVQLTATKSQPLRESSSTRNSQFTSERLHLLQKEHLALAESVRALEGEVIEL